MRAILADVLELELDPASGKFDAGDRKMYKAREPDRRVAMMVCASATADNTRSRKIMLVVVVVLLLQH